MQVIDFKTVVDTTVDAFQIAMQEPDGVVMINMPDSIYRPYFDIEPNEDGSYTIIDGLYDIEAKELVLIDESTSGRMVLEDLMAVIAYRLSILDFEE